MATQIRHGIFLPSLNLISSASSIICLLKWKNQEMMSQAKLLSNLILIKNYTRKKEELKSKSHCS